MAGVLPIGKRRSFTAPQSREKSKTPPAAEPLDLVYFPPLTPQQEGLLLLFTSSWFAPLPENHVRIGVSRGVPQGFRQVIA